MIHASLFILFLCEISYFCRLKKKTDVNTNETNQNKFLIASS
jgi:hypothetical protein